MITLHFTGHVGRDAEIKEVAGKQVVKFAVAAKQGKNEPAICVNCDYWTVAKVGGRQDQQTAQTTPAQCGAEEECDDLPFDDE